MKAAAPWMKFYPQDWRADERLRLCGLAARGLWLEMLAIMHRSERYGHLLIDGRVPTDTQLALLAQAPPSEVSVLITELETSGVFSRTAKGVIYSRRMTRDHKKAEIARKNGGKGGNPKLCKTEENPLSDNPPVKGEVKPQRPEARDSDPNGSGGTPPDPVKALFDLGVQLLTDGGMRTGQRSIIGAWRRDHGDAAVMAAIVEARRRQITEPHKWIAAYLGKAGHGGVSDLIAQASRYRPRAAA
jgi:hypothetical protein